MEKIIETLKRLEPGQYDMKQVAAASGENLSLADVGRQVKAVDGMIADGVRIEVSRVGRRLLVILQNVEVHTSATGSASRILVEVCHLPPNPTRNG